MKCALTAAILAVAYPVVLLVSLLDDLALALDSDPWSDE